MKVQTHLKSITIFAVITLFVVSHAKADESWIKIDYPGATWTNAQGVSGNNIVGTYGTGGVINHGFLYDGTNWTAINYPGAISTNVHAVDGQNIVGDYKDSSDHSHGFLYDGANWITIDPPGATANYYKGLRGISGGNIVGWYEGPGTQSFIYDGTTFTFLDDSYFLLEIRMASMAVKLLAGIIKARGMVAFTMGKNGRP